VYGARIEHESKTEGFLFFDFQSVSRANTVNINAPPPTGSGLVNKHYQQRLTVYLRRFMQKPFISRYV
jgi:hypothetical protein